MSVRLARLRDAVCSPAPSNPHPHRVICSYMHDDAEEWCGASHCCVCVLGHAQGWCVAASGTVVLMLGRNPSSPRRDVPRRLGERDTALHRRRLRARGVALRADGGLVRVRAELLAPGVASDSAATDLAGRRRASCRPLLAPAIVVMFGSLGFLLGSGMVPATSRQRPCAQSGSEALAWRISTRVGKILLAMESIRIAFRAK